MYTAGQIIDKKEHIAFANWNNANGVICNSRSTTTLTVKVLAGTGSMPLFWEVKGMSAQ